MAKVINKPTKTYADRSDAFLHFDPAAARKLSPSERALFRIRIERAFFEDQVLTSVKTARKAGVSWAKIGQAMGVSAQAVHRKYSHHI